MTITKDHIIDQICTKFNIDKNKEVKRKFGKLPAYTYSDILNRLLQYPDSRTPITEIFSEMTRPTISSMLKKAFPDKSNDKQPWVSYLLISVNLKTCSICKEIKHLEEFYKDISRFSNIKNCCKICDNTSNKIHREENVEHYKLYNSKRYNSNKAYYAVKNLKRKDDLIKATPCWANFEEMIKIYAAREPGEHVDHIIPINGKLVCGLNWEHNLQYLSAEDNLSKSNKFDSDMYFHELPI